MTETTIVEVALGERSYPVWVAADVCRQAGQAVNDRLGKYARTVVIVSNPKVWRLYGSTVDASLQQAGIRTLVFLMGDGERFKTIQTANRIWSFLIEQKVEREASLLALGGGVVGDMTGFIAATYLRGVPYVQMPTTLLAQIDSSVGGKTAVNHPRGKNLIGAFHQPALVLIDPTTLQTLPKREWNAGWCEALKYGVIRDASFFSELEHFLPFPTRRVSTWSSEDTAFLRQAIARCCRIKADVVEADEREGGLRRILNFGHTFGHAFEAVTRYRWFRHGEAVGYGMIAVFELALQLGMCTESAANRVLDVVLGLGHLPGLDLLDGDEVLQALQLDKKSSGGTVRFIVPTTIGEVVEIPSPEATVLKATLRTVQRKVSEWNASG
ncbi:MAG: 3-dehydroquinate synthase [Acidobacteria bacterium]|nr:3-dehydroquinate synthase [Acidobacteriota bacterium]